jgi:hypothetical protein
MPRVKLKRKVRKLDFMKSLIRFLKDGSRNFFVFEGRVIGVRDGENKHAATMRYNEAGELAYYKAMLVPRKPDGATDSEESDSAVEIRQG